MQGLLLRRGTSSSDRERELMGEILRHLVGDMEMAIRKRLAERLAKRSGMPRALVLELANDDIEIAYPILADSDVLADPDLIEVIRHRTARHQLAVSRRKSLSPFVSKVLVETGDEIVIESLLNNHGAQVPGEIMVHLVDRSRQIERFQGPLVQRPDLPIELAERMYMWVSGALRRHIAEIHPIDRAVLDQELRAATATAITEHERAQAGEPAEDLAARLFELGELDGPFLARALKGGEVALFEEALAQMSALRPKVLRRILYESGGDALALLCKAIDLDPESFREITRFVRARGAAQGKGDASEASFVQLFERTERADAERVVKRWRRSSDYLAALQKAPRADGAPEDA